MVLMWRNRPLLVIPGSQRGLGVATKARVDVPGGVSLRFQGRPAYALDSVLGLPAVPHARRVSEGW